MKKILASVSAAVLIAAGGVLSPAPQAVAAKNPPPPKLPKNFQGKGTYIVPSLGKHGVRVPFWWNGNDGNFRMVAGGPNYRIWFTNLVYNGNFYTYTYHWPGIPSVPCEPIPGASLKGFNDFLKKEANLVGPEILQYSTPRDVYHWRVASAWTPIPDVPIRFPFAQADIYVDQDNNQQWWQTLHFGYQNLYADDLDEWIKLDSWKLKPGKVKLPRVCR